MADNYTYWWDRKFDQAGASKNWLTEQLNSMSASLTLVSASVTALKIDEKGISVFGKQVQKWPWANALEARVSKNAALIKDLTQWNTTNLPVIESLQQNRTTLGTEIGHLEDQIKHNELLIKRAEEKQEQAKALLGRSNASDATKARSAAIFQGAVEAADRAKQQIQLDSLEIRSLQRSVNSQKTAIDQAITEGKAKYSQATDLKRRTKREVAELNKALEDMAASVNKVTHATGI